MAQELNDAFAVLERKQPILADRIVPPGQNEIVLSYPNFRVGSPHSRHPDVGSIEIRYTAGQSVIDQDSLEAYLASFSGVTAFAEDVVNRIFKDLNEVANPIDLGVLGKFSSDGDIGLSIRVNTEDNG